MMTDSDLADSQEKRQNTNSCSLLRRKSFDQTAHVRHNAWQGSAQEEAHSWRWHADVELSLTSCAIGKDLGYQFTLPPGTQSSAAAGVAKNMGEANTQTSVVELKLRMGDRENTVNRIGANVSRADSAPKAYDQTGLNECSTRTDST